MNIQSVSVLVTDKCANNCKFCVSNMRKDEKNKIMFNEFAFMLLPNSENTAVKLSIKKLKYLKKPRKPMLTNMLVNNKTFLLNLSSSLESPNPTQKSIPVLKIIKDKNRQSHQP